MKDEQQKNENDDNEIDELRKQAEEYLAGWKRAQADYQNREKEITKEKQALRGFFEESIVAEFIPILDNLKTALNGNSEKNAFAKGIEHIIKQFEDVLNNFGVQRIDVLDKDFDPALCEAAEKKGDGNKGSNIVADGYRKGDRVIRPARVGVG